MLTKQPLKQILAHTRDSWDRPETRPAVRKNFTKVLKCRTLALGAEVFASATEQKIVPHTCKSRACASCGHRATTLWQREQWAALPDIPYASVVFTMPDMLWPIFQQNRHLLHDLPVLAAAVIQQWAKTEYGVSVMVMVVPHTFGRHLNFNSHLHILVSGGGLRKAEARWISEIHFNEDALMLAWKLAVITYLRSALKADVLMSPMNSFQLKKVLTAQYERWWSVDIDHFESKEQFLRYAGRYARRPPIAQYRFVEISEKVIRFKTKDHKLGRQVISKYTPESFVSTLGDHVPDHCKHSIRYFGLLSPRSKGQTSAALFMLLGQKQRPRPARLGWAASIKRSFGVDPLLDSSGQRMFLIGRRTPY